jgi:3-hydroxyisobutyrate dehydrogenase-like beta-hydroxyacid dehydrogenase
VRPVLDVLGTTLSVGPLGSAAGAKLVANHALLALVASLGEAIRLADIVGLPRETTWEILAKTPLAAQAERRRAAVEEGSFPPRFPLRLALKDAHLIVEASSEDELWIAEAVGRWFEAASRAGYADADYTAVLDAILTTAQSRGDGNRSAT